MDKSSEASGQKQRQRQVISIVGEIIVALVIYMVIFLVTGHGLPCIFRATTGLLCPGCGMTHAMEALLHLDYKGAMEYNILSVTLLPVLTIYIFIKLVQYIKKGTEEFKPLDILFLLCCSIIALWFFLKRNNLI